MKKQSFLKTDNPNPLLTRWFEHLVRLKRLISLVYNPDQSIIVRGLVEIPSDFSLFQ